MLKTRVVIGVLLGILFVSAIYGVNYLYSSTTDGTGYVTVSTPPSISNVALYDSDNGSNLVSPNSTLTPNDPMTLVFNITDPDGLNTLKNITVIFYHSSTNVDGSDNVNTHATFFWSVSTNSWTVSPSPSTWAVNNSLSSVPTMGSNGRVILVFTPGKVALYSSSGEWSIYIRVYDQQGQFGESTTTNFNVASYAEIHLSVNTFNFGLVSPGVVNASLTEPLEGYINVTVISNWNFDLMFTSTDWLNETGYSILDVDGNKSILADDDNNPAPQFPEVGQSPFYINKTVIAPQWAGYSYTDETGTTIRLYLWVTLPSNIPPGTYHIILTVEVVVS